MKRYDTLGAFLADVPSGSVELHEAEVNLALWHHLSAVGAETTEVRWAADIEEGFELCRQQAVVGNRFWTPSPTGWERMTLWNPDGPSVAWGKRLYRQREEAVVAPTVRAARGTLGRRWNERRTSRTHRRWRLSYAAVPDPVNVHRLALHAVDEESIVEGGRPPREQVVLPRRPHENEWTRKAREEHTYADLVRTYESARARLPVLEPFVRLWASGAFCFWVIEHKRYRHRQCIVVPRPTVHLGNGRLHRTDGPAVQWDTGVGYWFWEGLKVPRRVVVAQGEQARLQTLVRTRNLELRRLLIDRFGYERFLAGAGSELVRQDDYGKLWRSELQVDDEPLYVVEVVNSTPETDGTYKRYFLRVPPTTRSARHGVAWTFGFDDPRDYELALQT